MDVLTFLTEMTEALAWPLVALILGLVFRKKLLDLIPAIRKLKAGPLEAEFELAAKQALSNAAEVMSHAKLPGAVPSVAAVDSGKDGDSRIVARLLNARNDPAGMIMEGWANVDGELYRLGHQMSLLVDHLTSTTKVYESVMASDVLPAETRRLVRELRDLRNKVAHVQVVPTPDSAQDYILAADRVVELIHNYRKSRPNYDSTSS